MQLRLQSIVPRTRVAGPGWRALIHVQGCTLACPGCFNPQTHDPVGGESYEAAALLARLTAPVSGPDGTNAAMDGIAGITVSGGEPLQQAAALRELLATARAAGLSTIVYSGYRLDEIRALPGGPDVLALTDVLIDGPYCRDLPCDDGYRGSSNQTLRFLTSRYGPADFPPQPGAFEAEIGPDGSISLRGFPSPAVRQTLRRV